MELACLTNGLRLSGVNRIFPTKCSFLLVSLMLTSERGRKIGQSGPPWEPRWACRQVGRTCHLTPVPQTISFSHFFLFSFQEENDLEQHQSSVFTHLFSSPNMWCMYEYTHICLSTLILKYEIPVFWVIWEGFIRIYLWLIQARGEFFFPFFSWGDSKSCGHVKENCPTFIPSSIIFVSSVIKCILGV